MFGVTFKFDNYVLINTKEVIKILLIYIYHFIHSWDKDNKLMWMWHPFQGFTYTVDTMGLVWWKINKLSMQFYFWLIQNYYFQGVVLNTVRFKFGDVTISDDDTPASLGIVEGDTINMTTAQEGG